MTSFEGFPSSPRDFDSQGIHQTQVERNHFPQRFDLLDRLRFLELLIVWEKGVRTNHLCHCFGISRKRASQDLAFYQQANPGALTYDGRLKLYVANTLFQPIYSRATEAEYINMLNRLHLWSEALTDMLIQTPGLDTMHYPQPATNRSNFATILRAIRRKRKVRLVVIEPDERGSLNYARRSVVPLRLVRTHLGWHLRSYDEVAGFDLIRLNRLIEDPELEKAAPTVEHDKAWSKFVCLTGAPKQDLTSEERTLINADWGISHLNPLTVKVRQPLAGLVLHYWERVDTRLTFSVTESSHNNWQNFA